MKMKNSTFQLCPYVHVFPCRSIVAVFLLCLFHYDQHPRAVFQSLLSRPYHCFIYDFLSQWPWSLKPLLLIDPWELWVLLSLAPCCYSPSGWFTIPKLAFQVFHYLCKHFPGLHSIHFRYLKVFSLFLVGSDLIPQCLVNFFQNYWRKAEHILLASPQKIKWLLGNITLHGFFFIYKMLFIKKLRYNNLYIIGIGTCTSQWIFKKCMLPADQELQYY